MNITEKLNKIQAELNVPKDQTNKFGKYKYRSCEDILMALKKPLKETGLVLTLNDSIEAVNERIYVHATAMLTDGENQVTVSAYAREPEMQKGMSDGQLTGATSSYARKYALAGLFLLDDNKDADTMDNTGISNTPNKVVPTKPLVYPDAEFNKHIDAWQKLIESKTHTAAQIAEKAKFKGQMTKDQLTVLKGFES